jgi:hypothetical protein
VRLVVLASSLVMGALLAAAPASALESLLGEWEGTLKCKATAAGVETKTKLAETVRVGSFEGNLAIRLVETNLTFLGTAIPDAQSAATGVVSAVSCDLGVATLTGGVLRGDAKTKAGSEKASLKLELILLELPTASSRSCRLTARRVSAVPPEGLGCEA